MLDTRKPAELRSLGKDVQRHLPAFFSLLIGTANETLLPDILEVIGHEKLVLFLDLFAGMTVTIPSRDTLVQLARDADIYARYRSDNVHTLANEHDLDDDQVREIYRRSKQIVEAVGIIP